MPTFPPLAVPQPVSTAPKRSAPRRRRSSSRRRSNGAAARWSLSRPKAFRAALRPAVAVPVFVHGIYLINLATDDETILTRSTSSLKSALTSCSQLGIKGVIFHLGCHKGQGLDAVFDQICKA